jgi:putative transposase
MGRIGRSVIPGFPHHVTQRGNRRQAIFFESGDQAVYRDLFAQRCRATSVEVWAYCLMPNHVHLVLALARPRGSPGRSARPIGDSPASWTPGRVGPVIYFRGVSRRLDEEYLEATARDVAPGPVRARVVAHARDWRWSSVRAHLDRRDDELVRVAPLLDRVGRFTDFIVPGTEPEAFAALRAG